jgi:hypothetical protein
MDLGCRNDGFLKYPYERHECLLPIPSYLRWKGLIVLLTVATLVFYWIGDIAEHASPAVDLEVRDNYKDTILSTLAATNHTLVLSNASIHLANSELDLQALLNVALAAHSQLMDALRINYVKFLPTLFEQTTTTPNKHRA